MLQVEAKKNDLTILCACLRNVFPVLKNFTDDLIAEDIKNADKVAAKFVALVKGEIELKFLPCTDLTRRDVLIQQGTNALLYVKRLMEENWEHVKPSTKTVCDHLELMQNRFDEEWPEFRENGIRFSYKHYQTV